MITGIDVLFVVIGLILLILFVEIWERYSNWSEWDRKRRRARQHYRYELQESFFEKEYRRHLRFELTINVFSTSMKKMQLGFEKMTSTMNKFTNAMKLLEGVDHYE